MMASPLVSIYIPTYNRAEYLRKSLDSLVIQPEFLGGKVEVVISDNASTDNTKSIGIEYSSKYPNVLYFRNEENIHDENFPLVLRRGNGRLLKLCNDTLLYKEDALELLCGLAEKYSVGEYENVKPALFFSNGYCRAVEGVLSFEEFLVSASYWTTWIGSFSCWKDELEIFARTKDVADTHLWQVEQICRFMERKNKAVIIPDVFCSTQGVKNKDISYGLYHVFYENYLGILKSYCDKGCFSNSCYDFLRKDLLLNFFPDWIVRWELQSKGLRYSEAEDLKQKVIDAYKDEPYFYEFKRKYKKALIKAKIQELKSKIKKIAFLKSCEKYA